MNQVILRPSFHVCYDNNKNIYVERVPGSICICSKDTAKSILQFCPSHTHTQSVVERAIMFSIQQTLQARCRVGHVRTGTRCNSVGTSSEASGALKAHLLARVAPLDRGFLGTEHEAQSIEDDVFALLDTNIPVRLDSGSATGHPLLLEGTWTLLYSSEFVPGNAKFPGNYPMLSNNRMPFVSFLPKIKNVEQVIDCQKKRLDNVVQIDLRQAVLDGLLPDPAPGAQVCLGHSYQIYGAQTMKITYDESRVKGLGGLNNWLETLPDLSLGPGGIADIFSGIATMPALDDYRSSSFDVVYLDEDMRITRGDRGEIRIFLRKAGLT